MKGEKYSYNYTVRPSDIWQVRMYYAYASYLAVVNVTCIAASVILILRCWHGAQDWFKALMVLFFSLFTVIQPLFIYVGAVRQAKTLGEAIQLTIEDSGIGVATGGKKEHYPWDRVRGVAVRPTLVILYTDASGGYILTNRILQETRSDCIRFIREHMK